MLRIAAAETPLVLVTTAAAIAAAEPPLVLVTTAAAAAAVSSEAVVLSFRLPVGSAATATSTAAAPFLVSRAHFTAVAEVFP